jgi:hypothetical protein
MNVHEIVQQLKQQRSQIDFAIQTLEGTRRRGRPPGNKRRTLSAAARQRISAAMKKRWAERKKKAKK